MLLIVVLSTRCISAASVSDSPTCSRILRNSAPSLRYRSVGGFLAAIVSPFRTLGGTVAVHGSR
ncbi:hypothetical protein GCM10017752_36810 [Streptomyces roseoviridis]